ncbi:MAG: hypothetical protein WEA04_04770 [Candidatus Andersenbacteria bacterium]
MPAPSSASTQTGSVLVSVATLIFIVAVGACAGVGWLLWHDSGGSWATMNTWLRHGQADPLPVLTPSLPPNDILQPQLTVHPSLVSQTPEFEKKLLAPLRAYYATKTERLGNISVAPADNPTHQTRVTYELMTPDGHQVLTFFYDRAGTDHTGPYPSWEPGLLDNTK